MSTRAGPILLAAVALLAGPATAGTQPPALAIAGTLAAVSASGDRVALATADAGRGCTITLVDLAHGGAPVAVHGVLPCAARWDGADASIAALWLGAKTLFAVTHDAPTRDGETRVLWSAKLPRGALTPVDAGWSWSADPPFHSGCGWFVAAGGGLVVATHGPNFLGVDHGMNAVPLCVGRPRTTIVLSGSSRTRLYLRGAWRPLATDGHRIALARLGPVGAATGRLALVDLAGRRIPAPRVDGAAVREATRGWLTPDGLVLRTPTGVVGPGWRLAGVATATVANGLVVYVRNGDVRVRTIRDGGDHAVLRLPADSSRTALAAGSFGVALAVERGATRTVVYRLRPTRRS